MTYYDDLEVPVSATADEIKAAYRRLAQDYHPDRNQGATEPVRRMAEERLKRANLAYATLKDPEKRRRYDAGLRPTMSTSGATAAPRHETKPPAWARPSSEGPTARAAGPDKQQHAAQMAALKEQVKDIARRRERIDVRFQRRLAEAQFDFEQAVEHWRLQQTSQRQIDRQRRQRLVQVWLAAAIALPVWVWLVMFVARTSLEAGALAWLAGGAGWVGALLLEGGVGWWTLGRIRTGDRPWRDDPALGVGPVAVVAAYAGAYALAALVGAWAVDAPTAFLWPLGLHGLIGLLLFLIPRPVGEAPEYPADRTTAVRQARERALSEFDSTVADELRRLLARLRMYEAGGR